MNNLLPVQSLPSSVCKKWASTDNFYSVMAESQIVLPVLLDNEVTERLALHDHCKHKPSIIY
jgi:hypothetical protein